MNAAVTGGAGVLVAVILTSLTLLARLVYRNWRDLGKLSERVAHLEGHMHEEGGGDVGSE
jgi:hypothetical protein